MSQGRSSQPESTDYWKKITVLTLLLGGIWLLVSLLPIILIEFPKGWTILGWPFAYAVVAFAAPLAYLAIIGAYALGASRADRSDRQQQSSD